MTNKDNGGPASGGEFVTRLCIGGPADGKYRSMQAGCDHMRVAEMPAPPVIAFSAENAAAPTVDSGCRAHNYYLAVSNRHGFVWLHEDYKGLIQ